MVGSKYGLRFRHKDKFMQIILLLCISYRVELSRVGLSGAELFQCTETFEI